MSLSAPSESSTVTATNGGRLLCLRGSDACALAAAALIHMDTASVQVVGFFWPRTLQRTLDAYCRDGDVAVFAALPASARSLLAQAQSVLDAIGSRRAQKGVTPRLVCLDLAAQFVPEVLAMRRVQRLRQALLPGERGLVLCLEPLHAELFNRREHAAFVIELARAFGPEAVGERRVGSDHL